MMILCGLAGLLYGEDRKAWQGGFHPPGAAISNQASFPPSRSEMHDDRKDARTENICRVRDDDACYIT